jgi:Putative peptidoglycan binding domain
MQASVPRALRRILVAAAVAIGSFGGASAQIPPAPTPRAVAPDPAFDAARAAFETLPEAERKAIQDALTWVGDYAGMADGSFGRQTYEAITAHQRRSKQTPNGVLDANAGADLRAAAQQARARAGFEIVDDPRSGVRIGVPAKLLTKRDANQSGGTRWQSADDKVTLDTRSLPVPEGGLHALYDRNLAIQTAGRQVTYKVIRSDFFVIAGETATGKFYTRYAAGDAGLRGFSIGYDKTLAKDLDRLVVAIANSFAPFPSAATARPVAAAPAPPVHADPGPGWATTRSGVPVPNAATAPPGAAAGTPSPLIKPSAAPAARLVATGLRIGSKLVVSTVDAGTCPGLRAGGLEPLQVQTADGLTIMDMGLPQRSADVRITARPLDPDTPLLVLAYRQGGSGQELVVTPGVAELDGTLSAPLQAGARGAPAFDRAGILRGLLQTGPDERRTVAGIVPPARYKLRSDGLAGLVAAKVAPATEPSHRSAADIAASFRSSVVPVTCVP